MRGSGWPMLSFGAGAARFMSNLQAGGLVQRADQRALAKLDLEFVVLVRLRLRERRIGGSAPRSVRRASCPSARLRPRARATARWRRRRARCAPAAPCRRRVERDGRGRQRELVGLAVADFQKQRAAGERRCRHAERGDQLARRERGLDLRCVARRAMQAGERRSRGCPSGRSTRPARRARSAPGRNRPDRWRCTDRWCRAPRAMRLMPSSAAQPEPGLRLLQLA